MYLLFPYILKRVGTENNRMQVGACIIKNNFFKARLSEDLKK